MKVQISFICNSLKQETIQICVKSKIDEQIVIYPNNGLQLSNKIKLLFNATTEMNLKIMMLGQKWSKCDSIHSRKCQPIYSDRT